MEYGIETVAQNPQVITIIIVIILGIVALFALWAFSRMLASRRELDKQRLALDAELYKLEKFASMKKKEKMGDVGSRAESFWPKRDDDQAGLSSQPTAVEQPGPASESQPEAQQSNEEEDEFADIRRENLVKDWGEND